MASAVPAEPGATLFLASAIVEENADVQTASDTVGTVVRSAAVTERTETTSDNTAQGSAYGVSALAASTGASPKYGGVVRWHEVSNPPKLDPHMATDTTSARITYCLFENLVVNSLDGQSIEPWLAESWSASSDGLTWTFKLRKGVYFHKEVEGKPTENGGREVTAEDWKWSFERMVRDKSPRAYFIEQVAGYQDMVDGKSNEWSGIKAIDKYTLQFTLSEPFSPFVSVLAYNSFVVVPKEDVLKWGTDFNFHPVGTGPFAFQEWKQDQRVTLKRNANYWRKDGQGNQLPYLDGWEMVIIPDGTVAWEEFKKGNIDLMRDVPERAVAEGRKLFGDHFLEKEQPGTYYWGFNMTKEPYKSNKALRHAFNYAIDRNKINELVLEGLWFPAKGVLPPSIPAYNPNLKGFEYNPAKARELMKEAGFEKGFEATLTVNPNVRNRAVAEAIQAQVAELGIKLNIQVLDWGVQLDLLDRGESDIYRMGWVADYLDPDNFLFVNLHSSNIGAKGNYSYYKNPEADKLMEEGRVETDPAKRIEIYQKAEEIIVEDAPWIYLFYYYNNLAVQKWTEGVSLPAFGDYTAPMDTVWINK
ncbi:MAG: ABC transporter substrate-binding protein [Synergistaceae bacterium]|jgi:peptide/nickel transport system substrate-binding protein/oligopeptide transport system substrate-binding protein|nr:ABC transporter substrate-binding protein [Synergistaceae bacterium]